MIQLSPLEYFGRALVSLGATNKDVVVLDADVSPSTKTTYFAERFPEKFINVGISEQDMIGVAAGLAASGKIAIACGFSMFVACRAWEQIANSVARPNLDVKIVGTHSGLSPYADGDSHQSFGDVALMRVLPNMKVVVPADAIQAVKAIEALVNDRGPSYLRLNRGLIPTVYKEGSDFTLGKAKIVREGSDATIMANGVMVHLSTVAAQKLSEEGVDVKVLDIHTVKPLDEKSIISSAEETGAVVTVEEHSVYGGLGGTVSETLSKNYPTPMQMLGISDCFGESSRDYWQLLNKHGLTADNIASAVLRVLEMNIR